MEIKELDARLEARLDRIEQKLDVYQDIGVKNSSDITWIKGFIKIGTAAVVATLGFLLKYIFNTVTGR